MNSSAPLSTASGLSPVESGLLSQTQSPYNTQYKSPIQPAQIVPPIGSQSSVNQPPPMQSSQIDPQVVAVANAIKNVESQGNYNAVGDNGSSMGAYQWNNGPTPVAQGQTPKNWQAAAQKYLGSSSAPMTPANQNYVAYQQIAAYKAQGLTPDSIDALWNGATPSTTQPGQYTHINSQRATAFANALQNIVQGTPQNNPQQPANSSGIQNPSVGGFLQNVAGSAGNFLGNLGNAVTHPIQTVENLGSAGVGELQLAGGESNSNTQAAQAINNYFMGRYSSPQDILKTLYTDPIGMAADLSVVLGGVGGAVGLAGDAADVAGLSDAADVAGNVSDTLGAASSAVNPLTLPVKGAGMALNAVAGPTIRTLGMASGLGGDVATTIASGGLTDMEDVSRESIANEVESAMAEKTGALSESGSGYDALRNSASYVNVTPTDLAKIIEENTGATVDAEGTVQAGGSISTPLQVRALQSLYDTYQPAFDSGDLSANEFLQLRTYVNSGLAKFGKELTTDPTLQLAGRSMYGALNDAYRSSFAGDNFASDAGYSSLEDMDSDYAGQKAQINELSQGLFNKDGSLKANISNLVANATKPGNEARLANLESLVPGITKEITALKALEQIQKLETGNPGLIGSTLKLGEAAGIGGGVLTGNWTVAGAALATMIVSSPDIMVKVLQAIGTIKDSGPLLTATAQQLTKIATSGAVIQATQGGYQSSGTSLGTSATNSPATLGTSGTPQTTQSPMGQTPQSPAPQGTQSSQPSTGGQASSPQDITSHPNYQAALAAGLNPQEIQAYMSQ